MSIALVFGGLLLGFMAAVPVGPVGLLIVQRTLRQNRIAGYAAGLGAAAADLTYSFLALLGLRLVQNLLDREQIWFGLAGGALLVVYGFRTFRERPRLGEARVEFTGLLGAFLSTFFLTVANPLNLALFAGLFTSSGLMGLATGRGSAVVLAVCVGLGAFTWWMILTSVVSYFRVRFSERLLAVANRVSGVLICLAGLYLVAAAVGWLPAWHFKPQMAWMSV
ncbi:MAG: LysE family transporter [Anaerolineales bacterium]|nr:LysE family transporter [Anaerolineales bacterium]